MQHLYPCCWQISTIQDDGHTRLDSLTLLDLSSNNLQALAAHNFRSMPALRSLSLYHNGVETVHPDSFAMLPQLEALDLSHNKVKAAAKS